MGYRDGEWRPRYEVRRRATTPEAVAAEVARSSSASSGSSGGRPTHLDSHQHVHRSEPGRSAVPDRGARLGRPRARGRDAGVAYSGVFYGQDGRDQPLPERVAVERLVAPIEELPDGATEFGCHPATADGPRRPTTTTSGSRGRDALRPARARRRSSAGAVLRTYATVSVTDDGLPRVVEDLLVGGDQSVARSGSSPVPGLRA